MHSEFYKKKIIEYLFNCSNAKWVNYNVSKLLGETN